ncbi:N-acetylglucosamine-6-phosphate deacetylase [Hydrogenispora ethanolica]|jgi:N-acetylglucosamine-6-phosphate deacetylase|uniref:N-acetylglucosamine-6-phosphate deacetylase n=1 Tax=Hydrogenispora ethanolica TaxID=1082276 RepID=A0A4R1QJG0_HYDET|nr:N-acetylglucosamine-6-phosphate deacetylase [Hydrogenispora ethanolica]TCL53676.1 N-acetylglucosamine-6-phosphate deacetylase [Hydrogenispora ethanolica]
MFTVLLNGKIITPFRRIDRGAVLIENDHIKEFGAMDKVTIPEGSRLIDVGGAFISPGFIDLHLHGAWGGDVMGATTADLLRMAQGVVKGGVTSFLPTTLSGPLPDIVKAVDCIGRAMRMDIHGAKILGAHLEGPYFSLEQKGAQNPLYIINPKPEDYLPLFDKYPFIIRVSAAPELDGALELGQELKRRGIVASIAHSNASYQEVLQAIEHGYTHATHIFSGMSTIKRVDAYRVAGVVESVLVLDELTTEMIADGHHLPPSLMKLVLKTKGIDKVCLVTDSMKAAGLGPGRYELGGLDVLIESAIPEVFEISTQERNYVAKLADRSAFASSVATMDQLVRNMVKHVGLNIVDAVKLVTCNPARMQGIDHERGAIAEGMKADITVFDENVDIHLTMAEGEIVYQND